MKKTIFLNLIGITIFVVILTKLDLSKILSILANTNLGYFILAILVCLPLIAIKAVRWNYIKRVQRISYPIKDSVLMYFSGLFVGLVTPGRIGELLKVFYLTKDGHSFGKSFLSVFLDRAVDLAFLMMFGYIGIAIFAEFLEKEFFVLSVLIIIALLIIIFLLLNSTLTKRILRFLFRIIVPSKYKDRTKIHFYDFYSGLKLFDKSDLLAIFSMTTFSWIFYFLQIYFLALALKISISFLYLATCVTIAGVFTLLPISISGIGTRDLTLVFLFSLLNIPKEFAVSLSMLILLMFIVAAFIGLLAWFIKPINLTKST